LIYEASVIPRSVLTWCDFSEFTGRRWNRNDNSVQELAVKFMQVELHKFLGKTAENVTTQCVDFTRDVR